MSLCLRKRSSLKLSSSLFQPQGPTSALGWSAFLGPLYLIGLVKRAIPGNYSHTTQTLIFPLFSKTSENIQFTRAPHRRQILSAAKAAGTDGMFHAHLAYPTPRKRKATIACEEGRVGGSHQSFERSVQDVYGERYTASILVLTGFLDGPNERWLETLGPASTDVTARDICNHRCWQTLSTRDSRDERDAWSTSHLLSAGNAGSPKQGAIPAW